MASISSPWSKLPSATASGRYALPESPRDSAQGWSRVAISNREDCHSTTSNGALFFVPFLREPQGARRADGDRARAVSRLWVRVCGAHADDQAQSLSPVQVGTS